MARTIGFDNQKYIETQSAKILERVEMFGDKLYLEFGGKLFDDYHAARVLPGFEPDSKFKMLSRLKDKVEILIAINVSDIEKNKYRSDLGITYDMDVIESKMDLFIDEFIDLDLQFFRYTEDEMWYAGDDNKFKVIFSSNEKAFKDYILSCGDSDVGELLLNGDFNSPIRDWKKYLPKYKIGGPLPWDVINLGYTHNFIEKEHDRIIKYKTTPWCDVSPCYKCKDNCFK